MQDTKENILPENYNKLEEHLKTKRKKKVQTQVNHIMVLTKFAIQCKKPFSEITEDDVDTYVDSCKFAKSTKRLHLVIIKSIMKSANPAIYHLILLEPVETTVTPSDRLKIEEIEKVINTATFPEDKAIISCLYDSGARIDELLSTEIKDATFDSYGCKLWLRESKTIQG